VKRRAAAGRKTTLHNADGEKLCRIISGQLLEIVAEIERQQPAKAGACFKACGNECRTTC
jgi:hypothetical protein